MPWNTPGMDCSGTGIATLLRLYAASMMKFEAEPERVTAFKVTDDDEPTGVEAVG
jgi:hypothetical protein